MDQSQSFIKFVPASQKEPILSFSITSIDVVAHEKLPNSGNHWALYLHTTGTLATTIQLDVSPSYSIPATNLPGGSKAFLIVSASPHSQNNTPNAALTKRFPLPVRHTPPLTVRELVEILTVKHARHRYEFDGQGRGCRAWIRDLIPLLLDEGVVLDETRANEATDAILLGFPEGTPFPMTEGMYY